MYSEPIQTSQMELTARINLQAEANYSSKHIHSKRLTSF